jgi:hypothetical protein
LPPPPDANVIGSEADVNGSRVYWAKFEGADGGIFLLPEALMFVPRSSGHRVVLPYDKIDSFTIARAQKLKGYYIIAYKYVEYGVLLLRSDGHQYKFHVAPYYAPLSHALKTSGVKRKMRPLTLITICILGLLVLLAAVTALSSVPS